MLDQSAFRVDSGATRYWSSSAVASDGGAQTVQIVDFATGTASTAVATETLPYRCVQ
jgi:hypothetical protein